MANLLDASSLPEGVAIEGGLSLNGKPAVLVRLKGRNPEGREVTCNAVMLRREALALGLQVSQTAMEMTEDRG